MPARFRTASPWLALAPLLALSLALSLAAPRATGAATCNVTTCTSVFHFVDFESFAPGAPVEGPGAVDPALTITSVAWPFAGSCPTGSARVVETGNPVPYAGWSTPTGIVNPCMGGTHGFSDDPLCVLDYDFTFAPGTAATCFSIRLVDFGDFFPYGGATHKVLLTAYDAANAVVDQASLVVTGGTTPTGDACSNQPGSPGNTRLTVAAPAIAKVSLTYDAFPDPNVGYDEITFCALGVTPALPRSWGRLKSAYR